MLQSQFMLALAGTAAGCINGLFGTGGGLMLVPILSRHVPEQELFPSSLAIITPICLSSLLLCSQSGLPWSQAWPYLLGGISGGIIASTLGKRIATAWLHRLLGCLILYAGVRYLC